MANPKHLAILKQGVIEWNQWREEHPELHADLGRAHLSWLDLSGADFRYVDLQSAELEQPGLSADFAERISAAKLNGAHMSGADFRRSAGGVGANAFQSCGLGLQGCCNACPWFE